MSFGLTNAPTTFMYLMNKVFQDYLDSFLIVFIDVIYFKNEYDHESHLRLALQVLKEHQLYAKSSKCEFLVRSVAFLGHIISGDGVEVDVKEKDVVKNYPRLMIPQT